MMWLLSVNNVNKSNKRSKQDSFLCHLVLSSSIVFALLSIEIWESEKDCWVHATHEMNRALPMEVGCPNSHTLYGHLSVSISKPWVGNQLFWRKKKSTRKLLFRAIWFVSHNRKKWICHLQLSKIVNKAKN